VAIVAELIARRRGRLEGLRTKRISAQEMRTVTGAEPVPEPRPEAAGEA
jgi:hypothetical protein